MAPVRAADRKTVRTSQLALPVIEIFGPTVQGEGPEAGRPANFVRFGGCDFRCSWCDSMYAVEPAEVRAHAEHLSTIEICDRLAALAPGPTLVVLSGGNPALLDLGQLVDHLHELGHEVAVETQGSVWRDWLGSVDRLVISPKGPSSQMLSAAHTAKFQAFMESAARTPASTVLKVVIFDGDDLAYAETLARDHIGFPLFLSAGTDVGLDDEETRSRLLDRYRWLCEAVARSPVLAQARVLPQLHVLAWGTVRGV